MVAAASAAGSCAALQSLMSATSSRQTTSLTIAVSAPPSIAPYGAAERASVTVALASVATTATALEIDGYVALGPIPSSSGLIASVVSSAYP